MRQVKVGDTDRGSAKKVEQVFSSAPIVVSITDSYKLQIPGNLDEAQLGWVFWPKQTWRGPLPAGSG